MANYNINTICVQGGYEPKKGESRVVPIVQSTTFKYETSQQICQGSAQAWRTINCGQYLPHSHFL